MKVAIVYQPLAYLIILRSCNILSPLLSSHTATMATKEGDPVGPALTIQTKKDDGDEPQERTFSGFSRCVTNKLQLLPARSVARFIRAYVTLFTAHDAITRTVLSGLGANIAEDVARTSSHNVRSALEALRRRRQCRLRLFSRSI